MKLNSDPAGTAIIAAPLAVEAVAAEPSSAEPETSAPTATPLVAEPQSSARSLVPHGTFPAFQSLLYIIVVALFIITFSVQPFRIPSESMEPTLMVGDFLLVAKLDSPAHASGRNIPFLPSTAIRRGDVIVFHYPIDPSIHLVKRVIGLPGDHLRLRNNHVFIDGHPLVEPYAVYRPGPSDSFRDTFPRLQNPDPDVTSNWWIQMRSLVNRGELTIPPGSFFVLGDNRNDSEDSRYWGFVPATAIVGKPLVIYFSLNEPSRDQSDDPDDDPPPPRLSALLRTKPSARNSFTGLASFARWDRIFRIVR